MESANHLFVHYHYSVRIWSLLMEWFGIFSIDPPSWKPLSLHEWCLLMTGSSMPNRKAIATLTLLTSWEIWNERNARVFRNKLSPTFVLFEKIKKEARLWVTAGAKGLSEIMPGE